MAARFIVFEGIDGAGKTTGSKEALAAYAKHPLHLEAKEHFFHFIDKRVAADFEV